MSGAAPVAAHRLLAAGDRTLAIRTVGLTFLVLALVEAALLYRSPAGPYWVLLLFPGYGLVYTCAGLLAWSRRPENGFGALVVFGGLLLLVAGLLNVGVEHTALVMVGLVLAEAPVAGVLHLLLAFPSGRLTGSVDRALVLAIWFVVIALQAPSYLLVDVPAPFDGFQFATDPGLARAAVWAQNIAGGAILLAAAVVMARRLRAADRTQQRNLGLVAVVGIVTILFIPVSFHLAPVLGVSSVQLFVAQVTALGIVPVAFVLAALRGGFARTDSLAELSARLGTGHTPGDRTGLWLRDAVAAAVGDPSLQLLFRASDGPGYVDATGSLVPPPAHSRSRGTAEIELSGLSIGAIVYDCALLPNPDVVVAAGRVLAIALDRERLISELASSREAVRESRTRIVLAADRERRRVERNLHDGAQQRLTGLGLLLRIAGDRATGDPQLLELLADAHRELTAGLAELRLLARGLHPAILTDAGLAAALEALAERSPVAVQLSGCPAERLPEPVEAAVYYVVAEALTNAAKHSGATSAQVRAERYDGVVHVEVHDNGHGGALARTGSGLEGLRDRVEAAGGQLRLHSPPGGGTRLEADVPCA